MLVWPLVVSLGFVFLNGVVIALGASSTAGFDFDRNRAREEKVRAAAVPAVASAAAAPSAAPAGAAAAGAAELEALDALEELQAQRSLAVSVAAHPAGKLVGANPTVGWWLVADPVDDAGNGDGQVLAGPFADRMDAEWAAFSGDLDASPVYGVHQPGRGLVRRPCPQDQDWLGELGDHLDRLSDDWTELVTDSDPLTSLVVELAAVLVEAGVSLRDGSGQDPTGGVCLTPAPDLGGILLSWQPHDRMTMEHARGPAVSAAVQHTLSSAVADLLLQLGFAVESFGPAGCHLVRG